jgi:hypothetical protein
MKWKIPGFVGRYVFEAVLIFGSVYGAFLLENQRAVSFERKIFIEELKILAQEIYFDSIKFHDFYEDIDSDSGFAGDVDLWFFEQNLNYAFEKLLREDSMAYDSIFSMLYNGNLIAPWEKSYFEDWDSETSTYANVRSKNELFINKVIINELKQYMRYRTEITTINDDELAIGHEVIFEDLLTEYKVHNMTMKDKQEFLNRAKIFNILDNLNYANSYILDVSREITKYSGKLRLSIQKEIEAQKKAL